MAWFCSEDDGLSKLEALKVDAWRRGILNPCQACLVLLGWKSRVAAGGRLNVRGRMEHKLRSSSAI